MKKTEQNGIYGEFILILTRAQTAQKWEVFAQFWEAELPTLPLIINSK
ncbi:MAG: hypothetical protein IAE95_00150 [Chitinophagaceae bacterium]|nr:hypothetical protein [Chitinophagaceae bacterium]